MYALILLKRKLEAIFIGPFAWLGALYARKRRIDTDYDLFFFFPFYHTGGAEKVHSEIIQLFPQRKIALFFTKKSQNRAMYAAFQGPNIHIIEISRWTDNKWLYPLNFVFRGLLAAWIHQQKKPVMVFNGQCNFAYKLSPHVRSHIPQIELIHSFCSFSYIRLPFLPFISQTVMISKDAIAAHVNLYKRFNVPEYYYHRIRYIQNGIDLPDSPFKRASHTSIDAQKPLKLLYVGRGTSEKRPFLLAQMALEAKKRAMPIEVGMVGDVNASLNDAQRQAVKLYGEITDATILSSIYQAYDVIVIVSSREGFPMVIMEGMAHAMAVLSTAVGDIPHIIQVPQQGYLIEAQATEEEVVSQGLKHLQNWINHPSQLQEAQMFNQQYAYLHFDKATFAKAYQDIMRYT
jgi:glycosyltransferase involved in cell wall biosynthesis